MNFNGKENFAQTNFTKSIIGINNNLLNKNNNFLYPYDSFRPGNFLFNEFGKTKKSVSPNKYLTSKDFSKIVKRNNTSKEKDKNKNLDGKSKSLFKMNDIVNNLYTKSLKTNFI